MSGVRVSVLGGLVFDGVLCWGEEVHWCQVLHFVTLYQVSGCHVGHWFVTLCKVVHWFLTQR